MIVATKKNRKENLRNYSAQEGMSFIIYLFIYTVSILMSARGEGVEVRK